ncbi:MAG: response regulator [Lachnospiraceae bacterium]|nr:response regulator [Lachnospiraceae bacterium]
MISALIVDDEKLARNTLKKVIPWEELGIRTLYEASDGRQAFELVKLHRPDIIISDIKMPHMDGIEFARLLRESEWPSHLIFLSGYTDKAYLKDAIHLHVDGYIEKPLHPEEISELLRTVVERCRQEHSEKKDTVFFFRNRYEDSPLNNTVYEFSKQSLQIFADAIKQKECNQALSVLRQWCEEMKCCEGTDPDYLRGIFGRITMQVEKAAELNGAGQTAQNSAALLHRISGIRQFSVLCESIQSLTRSLFMEIETTAADPAGKIQDYLAAHFREPDLSIQDIARHLNFNQSYLSTVYKQKTNTTINATLTALRMEEAKRLLAETDLKLYQVGEQVGYRDGKYFTKLFTRETGVSPRQYRERRHDA